ncbi:hypothetical protein [Streptomyces venezuelae]
MRVTQHVDGTTHRRRHMDRQQILDLYVWAHGVCFRHPVKGVVPTVLVGVVHPRANSERQVRACDDCVIALEDIKREQAAREGSDYQPGSLGGHADQPQQGR